MSGSTIIAIALHAIILAAAVWDITAYASGGKFSTVSSVLATWARAMPIFPITVGVVIGHLFWPPDKQ